MCCALAYHNLLAPDSTRARRVRVGTRIDVASAVRPHVSCPPGAWRRVGASRGSSPPSRPFRLRLRPAVTFKEAQFLVTIVEAQIFVVKVPVKTS